MHSSNLPWKVGLFVAIGLLLLAALLLEFSKGLIFSGPTLTLHLDSENVVGLKVRADVLMSGVPVGSVSDVSLDADGKRALITLKVNKAYKVYQGSRFVLEQSGFLGDEYVAILSPTNRGPPFVTGARARLEPSFDMQDLARAASGFVLRIDQTAKRLDEAVSDVRRFVLNQQTLTNLAATIANFRVVSEKALTAADRLDSLIASNAPGVAQSGSNLLAFSEQMNLFAGSLRGVVASNRVEVAKTVENLESSSEILKGLLEDVNAGKGLAGALFKNEQLATNVADIADNLSITTSNLNRRGLWGILWRHKPSPPSPAHHPALGSPKHPSQLD